MHAAACGARWRQGGRGRGGACSSNSIYEVTLGTFFHARVTCCVSTRCCTPVGNVCRVMQKLTGYSHRAARGQGKSSQQKPRGSAAIRNVDAATAAAKAPKALRLQRGFVLCLSGKGVTRLPPLSTVTLPSALCTTAGGRGSSEFNAAA